MSTLVRALYLFTVFATRGGDGLEVTDRLAPPGFVGNPWGPAATLARETGAIPPIPITPYMQQWDRWGRTVLRDGDLLFRRGDARILFGYFPFSRFLANLTGSAYSHVGVVAIERGMPVVYDTTKASVRRQPFYIWILDDVETIGLKRLRPAYRDRIPGVIRYLRRVYQEQVPFDYNLDPDDSELYCVEMAEKAFRTQGLILSQPVRIRDMERFHEFPINVFIIRMLSWVTLHRPLSLDQPVFCPGNERHGIWSSPYLETIYPKKPAAAYSRDTASPGPRRAGS
jgi:hypothetical protein